MRLLLALLTMALFAPAAAHADPVIDAVNAERARRDLAPLIRSVTLERSATSLAQRLMREQRFDHEPVVPPRFELFGEALLLDFSATPRVSAAIKAWLESPEHRRLLLTRRMRYVGAGDARGTFDGLHATIRVLHVGRLMPRATRASARSRRPWTAAR